MASQARVAAAGVTRTEELTDVRRHTAQVDVLTRNVRSQNPA